MSPVTKVWIVHALFAAGLAGCLYVSLPRDGRSKRRHLIEACVWGILSQTSGLVDSATGKKLGWGPWLVIITLITAVVFYVLHRKRRKADSIDPASR